MNWYLQSGNDSDVVISSKIELIRNVNCFRFNLSKKEEIEKFENLINEKLYSIGYGLKFLKLKDMDSITRETLVEKGLISREFMNSKNGSILINDDENICILLNDIDHIKIQVFSSGFELENLINLAIEIDEVIGNLLEYSISKKYGYLTVSPANVGTGLKAFVKMHLPGLSMTNNLDKMLNTISRFGIDIMCSYRKNNVIYGDMYEISNVQTLGVSETEIIKNINNVAQKVIDSERSARKMLASENINLEDRIYRSYGILTNCRKISKDEAINLLSDVKLGVDLGILDELTDAKIMKLYQYINEASLQKFIAEKLEKYDRDIKRAMIIKDIVSEK